MMGDFLAGLGALIFLGVLSWILYVSWKSLRFSNTLDERFLVFKIALLDEFAGEKGHDLAAKKASLLAEEKVALKMPKSFRRAVEAELLRRVGVSQYGDCHHDKETKKKK